MSQKLTTEDSQNELSWEEAISRYLEEHPDYFLEHPEALAQLKLRHETGGRAMSLIERQVQVLRDREQALNRQLRELITVARENDVLGLRVQRFALAMLDSHSLDDTLDAATELLRQEFKLDAVVIRLSANPAHVGTRPEFVEPGQRQHEALLKQLSAGKPICGGRYEEALLSYLFGERRAEIRSTALIPLGDKVPRGLLALGSQDPHRFHPGMGTVYLARLGELLIHALGRVAA